ncbi:hypothetical protein Tco_0971974 [Tanacetum coccineum]
MKLVCVCVKVVGLEQAKGRKRSKKFGAMSFSCIPMRLIPTLEVTKEYILQLPVETPEILFVAPVNIETIEVFMNGVGYQGVVDKKFPEIPKRIKEDYHSIKDDIPLVIVYTTADMRVRGMLIPDAFLTKEIRAINDFKEYEMVFMKGVTTSFPPMLENDMYDSWKNIMELYMMNRQHGRMIFESVENGPLIWPTIEENGVTRPKKYSELSATEAIQVV